jgi:hypothetical protein
MKTHSSILNAISISAFQHFSVFYLLLILLVLTPRALRAGEGDNLIPDGGFEEWGGMRSKSSLGELPYENDEAPVYWRAQLYPPDRQVGSRPLVAKDSHIKHGGDYSLRMDLVEEEVMFGVSMQNESGSRLNVVPVEPGQRYVLRGWFKGKDLSPRGKHGTVLAALIYLSPDRIFDEGAKRKTVTLPIRDEGTTEWTAFEKEFETSPEENSLWLSFRVLATDGKIWLDDVEIVPAP